jgi:hypothetical protein
MQKCNLALVLTILSPACVLRHRRGRQEVSQSPREGGWQAEGRSRAIASDKRVECIEADGEHAVVEAEQSNGVVELASDITGIEGRVFTRREMYMTGSLFIF